MQQWIKGAYLTFCTVVLILAIPAMAAQSWQVAVQKAAVRQTPQVFGKIATTVNYGTTVEVQTEQKGWYKVRVGGTSGWLHSSALARTVAPLRAGTQNANVAASQEELTLAGKGFNSQVEDAYRQKNRNLDFAWIDRMEKMTVDDTQLQQFLLRGDLDGGAHAN
jgi:uncharacterized protein YgiM (DUF1202 family)